MKIYWSAKLTSRSSRVSEGSLSKISANCWAISSMSSEYNLPTPTTLNADYDMKYYIHYSPTSWCKDLKFLQAQSCTQWKISPPFNWDHYNIIFNAWARDPFYYTLLDIFKRYEIRWFTEKTPYLPKFNHHNFFPQIIFHVFSLIMT